MKVLILAAGMGKRLGKHSKGLPKALVEIEAPLLAYTLKNITREGIRDFVVVTGHGASKLKDFVGRHSRKYGLRVKYVHNRRYGETNNIYSTYLARDELEGDDFILVNSDVLFHPGILRILMSTEKSMALSVDFRVRLGEEEMKVRVEDDRVVEISKKIPPEKADGEYIGLTRINAESTTAFFDAVEETLKLEGHNVFYEAAFQRMIDKGDYLAAESTRGLPWIEIDTPEDLRIAREIIAPRLAAKHRECY